MKSIRDIMNEYGVGKLVNGAPTDGSSPDTLVTDGMMPKHAARDLAAALKDAGHEAAAVSDADDDSMAYVYVTPGGPIDAIDEHIATIKAGAYNAWAREMSRSGVRLTHDQADKIGDVGQDWLRNRLSLAIETDDRGLIATPADDDEHAGSDA